MSFRSLYTHTSFDYPKYLRIGLYQALPLCITVITTVLILCHLSSARRVSKRCGSKTLGSRGIATVVITVLVYCVSVFPHSSVYIYELTTRRAVADQVRTVATCLTSLNTMSNIYVYYLTIPSLREFIRVDILKRLPPGSRTGVNQGLPRSSLRELYCRANFASRRIITVSTDLVTVNEE